MKKLVLINIAVFFALWGILEVAVALLNPQTRTSYKGEIFSAQPAPYVEWINSATLRNFSGSYSDLFAQRPIPFTRSVNNYGFRSDMDFDWAGTFVKQPNEKVVLLTGGSAAAGAGASSDNTIISAHMERVLNEAQSVYKYRVVNFGNGGWVSFQQYISLILWGKPLDPDWIITMDGRNDIAVACASGQGAGYPMHYHLMKSYIDSYLANDARPVFYRGWLENQIIRFSGVYRWITGKAYIPNPQYFPPGLDGQRVGVPTTWNDVERQLIIYLRNGDNIVNISRKAKYILSLQPLVHDWKYLNGEIDPDLQALANKHKDQSCGLRTYQVAGVFYFYRMADKMFRALAEKHKGENVSFYNMHFLFPEAGKERQRFFLDEAHMTDIGQESAGTFYAYRILQSDMPERAGEWENALQSSLTKLTTVAPGAAGLYAPR